MKITERTYFKDEVVVFKSTKAKHGGLSNMAGGYSIRVNDIIIELNGTRIRNNDELASFLSDKTFPEETLIITIVRDDSIIDLSVILGKRPAPPI